MLTAAAHPDLVRGLVLVDAGAAQADPTHPAAPATPTTAVPVPGSATTLHLDRPAAVHSLLSAFLAQFRQPGGPCDPLRTTSFTRT